MTGWLEVTPGDAPLIVSIPHAGTDIPADVDGLQSPALACHDTDFHVERLYGFASELGATVLRTRISRTVIDVNRDPSGASLYPGQATTGLCPETTFDGSPLYQSGRVPGDDEIARRRSLYFEPYHDTLAEQIARLRTHHRAIVVYDAHSIRSRVPRLFDGELPLFNIGSFDGASCARGPDRRHRLALPGRILRGQRSLPRRLDHATLRQSRQWHPCRPDGTRDARLPGRSRTLATDVGDDTRCASTAHTSVDPPRLSRLRADSEIDQLGLLANMPALKQQARGCACPEEQSEGDASCDTPPSSIEPADNAPFRAVSRASLPPE